LLLVPVPETLLRAGILLIITVIAGYVPARMIIGRNTLDAILGR
jgi:ABC-type antimicrobial peptide transport system permease subunit